MDADVVMEKDMFLCAVCMEDFQNDNDKKQPKLLRCGHTFCQSCLNKLANKSGYQSNGVQFYCPICRTKIILGRKGINALPNDFRITELQQTFDSLQKRQKMKFCEICPEQKATTFCGDCQYLMCRTCHGEHSESIAFKDHNVTILSNVDLEVNNYNTCAKHMKESKHYCMDCQKSVCVVCVMKTICQKHDVQNIITLKKEKLCEVYKIMEELKKISKEYPEPVPTDEVTRVKHSLCRISQMRIKLNHHTDELLDTVRKRHNNLDETLAGEEKQFQETLSSVDQNNKGHVNICTMLQSLTQVGTLPITKLLSELKTGADMLRELKAAPTSMFQIDHLKEYDLTMVNDISVGHILPRDQSSFSDVEEIPLKLRHIDYEQEIVEKTSKPELYARTDNTVPGWGITYGPEGKICMTHGFFKGLTVMHNPKSQFNWNTSGDMSVHIESSLYGIIWDTSQSSIMATVPFDKGLKIYSFNNQVETHISLDGVFEPTGLCQLRDGSIVVTDTGCSRHGLSIHTLQGTCVHKWGARGSNSSSHFLYPTMVSADSNDRIFVCDTDNQLVKVFDVNGKYLFQFDHQLEGSAMLPRPLSPRAIKHVSNGNVFISFANIIALFSPNGRFIQQILKVTDFVDDFDVKDGEMVVCYDQNISFYTNMHY